MGDDKIKAQVSFNQWVNDWMYSNPGDFPKEKVIQPDILDIMAIFKILGFETFETEVSNPKDVPKLKNFSNGIKIVVSCSTSGMQCSMELKTNCKCPPDLVERELWNEDSNQLIKYTVNKKEVDDLLTVSPETEFLVQSLTNHFFHLIANSDQNTNNNGYNTPTNQLQTIQKSPSTYYLARQQNFLNNYNPTIQITTPGFGKSPSRYRSLDTLIENLGVSEIPEPGRLRKDESNDKMLPYASSSSPDIAKMQRPSTSSPCHNCEPVIIGYKKLLEAQFLINEVVGIMENNQNAAKLDCNISKIKGSIDSLLEKQKTIVKTTPNVTTLKPKCRAPIRSVGSVKTTISKSPITKTKLKTSSATANATKSLENVATGTMQKTPIIKPNPKYMHIKSTISKTKTVTTTKK